MNSAMRLLLLGGGHSHALALLRLADPPPPPLRITLMSPSELTPYSGMLPGWIAGHYRRGECFINLAALAGRLGIDFVQAAASHVDADSRLVKTECGARIGYDVLSINTGAIPSPPFASSGGGGGDAMTVKPIDDFIRWLSWLEDYRGGKMNLVVVGGGASGVETALAADFRLRRRFGKRPREFSIAVAEAGDAILPQHPPPARRRVGDILRARKIEVMCGERAESFFNKELVFAGGRRIAADKVVFATPAESPKWTQTSGLQLDSRGFVLVNRYLQSVSHAEVFACGDIASHSYCPLPKSGVFAVRQGFPLARNLLALAANRPLIEWMNSPRALSIISIGEKSAVASRGGLVASGRWVWRWKDFLDRRFMNKFSQGGGGVFSLPLFVGRKSL